MDARWLIVPFDWGRFHDLAPRLSGADRVGLEGAAVPEEAASIAVEFESDSDLEAIRNAVLAELCAVGDGALFESGLASLLAWLRRQPAGVEPADILAELITTFPNTESWFRSDSGLVGILSLEQTSDLARHLHRFQRSRRPAERPRGLAALSRHFKTTDAAAERLNELLAVVEEAAAEMHGLAAIRVE